MNTLEELLEEQIKDLYNAEQQLAKALPKMVKAATAPELKEAFKAHLEETRGHIDRLEQVAGQLGFKPTGKACKAMKGLIEEGAEAMEEDGDDSLVDGAIIAAAQKIEHYEISGYGTVRSMARQLGHEEVAELLGETLDEESAADEKLTEVAEQSVYSNAPREDSEDDEEDGEESVAAASPRGRSSSRGRNNGRTAGAGRKGGRR